MQAYSSCIERLICLFASLLSPSSFRNEGACVCDFDDIPRESQRKENKDASPHPGCAAIRVDLGGGGLRRQRTWQSVRSRQVAHLPVKKNEQNETFKSCWQLLFQDTWVWVWQVTWSLGSRGDVTWSGYVSVLCYDALHGRQLALCQLQLRLQNKRENEASVTRAVAPVLQAWMAPRLRPPPQISRRKRVVWA